jgi:hypothetical protein
MARISNSNVEIHHDRVTKTTATPSETARKYEELHRASLSSNFTSPRVISIDKTFITLERLDGLSPIYHQYISSKTAHRSSHSAVDLFNQVGRILGDLHTLLPSEGSHHWAPPPSFEATLSKKLGRSVDLATIPRAPLHADYSFANLFIQDSNPRRIVVLDPCANFGSTFHDRTVGPVYLDIGKMLACLEGQVKPKLQLSLPTRQVRVTLQKAFLKGYEARVSFAVDRRLAHAFAYATVSAQFARRGPIISKILLTGLYNGIKGNTLVSTLEDAADGALKVGPT